MHIEKVEKFLNDHYKLIATRDMIRPAYAEKHNSVNGKKYLINYKITDELFSHIQYSRNHFQLYFYGHPNINVSNKHIKISLPICKLPIFENVLYSVHRLMILNLIL
jgi:hypothetical protein